MRAAIDLFRHERRAVVFFATLTQSSLGTGAGYVALLLVAFSRFDSPWAISIVLLADLLPAMLLGPIFGAAADRFSRRSCVVASDLLRAVAFTGIAVANSFEATVAFAVLAGTGTGLFTPAALASLPSLVSKPRLPAATSVYGAISDVGFTAGPALAAGLLLVLEPEAIVLINGVTFGLSALVLAVLRFGPAPGHQEGSTQSASLMGAAADGVRAARRLAGISTILLASSLAFFFVGMFNVAELPFAEDVLGTTGAGFSMLVAVFGLGFIAGSLAGARGGALPALKRRYLLGLAVMGAGFLASGLAPSVAVAALTLTVTGFGNGLVLVYERLLIQATVPDEMSGRIFGIKDSLASWAFGVAFLAAGVIVEFAGVREAIVVSGAGGLVAWVAASWALRDVWNTEDEAVREPGLGRGAHTTGDGVLGQDRPDAVGAGEHGLALLDDLK